MAFLGEIERASRKRPRKHAVVFRGGALTYEDIAKQADSLSSRFLKLGLESGSRVAIILPQGPAFIVAVLAAWKAGAVAVPLHVKLREREILQYAADCKPRLIVSAGGAADLGPSIRETAFRERIETSENEDEAPALTQFSTGSMGVPKQVTRAQKHLLGEFHAVSAVLGLNERDRILGVAPFFHNYGFMNAFFFSLMAGATLYPVEGFTPRETLGIIESEKITGLPGNPVIFGALASASDSADLSSLRYALSAGAPLSAETAASFSRRYGIEIRQLYGTTETGVVSISGAPVPGVAVKAIGDDGDDLPPETNGVIAIRSPFAAHGYDEAPAGPAGSADPIGKPIAKKDSYFSSGWFFPGDLGRLDAQGRVFLSGRRRHFINVAGNKVDPTEVEKVLAEFPGVKEVAVVGVPDSVSGEAVKAVLVTLSECSRIDILRFCERELADFKHPKIIEFRAGLPRNSLGKILRKELVETQDS